MAKPTPEEEVVQLKNQVRAWRDDTRKLKVRIMFMESAVEVLAEAFQKHLSEASRQVLTEHFEESIQAAYRMLDARFGADSPLFNLADERVQEMRDQVIHGKPSEPSSE